MLGILSFLVLPYVVAYLWLHKILPHHNYTMWLSSTLQLTKGMVPLKKAK